MLIDILAAAGTAGAATPTQEFGFVPAIKQGGAISIAILTVLVIMSVGSFYILITKLIDQNRILSQYKAVSGQFWRANTLNEAATKLDKNSAWRQIVDDGLAADAKIDKMGDSLEAHDWLHGSLARSEAAINSKLAGGLPFLATVGATAPFVGLLGTVIGIYRALIAIGLAGSASIDKVAGPVGEALIMTAIGLLVAVPAVLAYNWLMSRNKRIAELLSGFSTDLLAYISSKGTVRPEIVTKTSAAPAAKTTAKPATTTPAMTNTNKPVTAPATSTTTPKA